MNDVTATYSVTAAELRQFIERAEQLACEKKDIGEQEKELFAEAKGRGYDTAVMRKVIAMRKGEGSTKGEAWRTRLIYRTNLATSRAAGRFAQLTRAGFAYWVYFHGNSREPRLQHLGWNGLILPPDHPFWATHYPPNGWGCSCYVSGARSIAGAERLGGKPGLKLQDGWQTPDPRTGAPAGIDKGWGYAPGRSVVNTVNELVAKLDVLPARPSIDLIQSWLKMDAFAGWLSQPAGLWPVARISADDAVAINSQTTIAKLSSETVAKQMREHPELTALDYLMIQETVDHATYRVQDTPNSLIFVLEQPGANGYVLVVKATMTGKELFLQSFRRLSADQVKRDEAIRRLLRRKLE